MLTASEKPKPPEPQIPKLAWHSDLGRAATEAREKSQPLLLLLELPDQTWSRQMLEAFSNDAVVKRMQQFVPLRLNIHLYTQLLDQLAVNTIPDLRVFTSDGRQLAHITGQMEAAALEKFLEEAAKAKPEEGAPTLSMLFPSADLDGLLQLEHKGKLPGEPAFARLMEFAGGRLGETRVEATRLLRKWARPLAQQVAAELSQKALKRRLAAFEALKGIDVPLEGYDPWSGPVNAAQAEKLAAWARKISSQDASAAKLSTGGEYPPLTTEQKEQVEADLRVLAGSDEARMESARQRLVGVGKALVPLLRDRARAVMAQQPALSVRCDELRFRLLLSGEALRKQPGIAMRLAAGSPGSRAGELERILRSGAPGLSDLGREAACDRDAVFRETAIRNLAQVMDNPEELYRDALRDAEPNVRTAALKAIAASSSTENAKALAAYLESEKDSDMICHAARALGAAKSALGKEALRKLLSDPRWQVRATAAEELGGLKDREAAADLAGLLEGDDGFVAARAVEALAKTGDNTIVPALGKAVDKHPDLTLTVLKALGNYELRKAKQTDALLRRFTKNAVPEVRAQALLALARDNERPAFDEVAEGLKDESVVVRTAAVEAMRSLISQSELRKLLAGGKPNKEAGPLTDDPPLAPLSRQGVSSTGIRVSSVLLPLDPKKLSAQGIAPPAYLEVREKITGMMNDSNERLAMQAALTLCYFGDGAVALPALKKLVVNPAEETREQTYYGTLYSLSGEQVLELIRLRLAEPKLEIPEQELGVLVHALHVDADQKDADWQPDASRVEAYFTLLPHLPKESLDSWFQGLYRLFCEYSYELNKPPLAKKSRQELAKMLRERLNQIPPGLYHDAAELLWMRAAELDDAQLAKYRSDPRMEVRRMAVALQVRAVERGPDELVKALIKDPAPEIRSLAVAAAIPVSWRRFLEDPTEYDLVGGEHVSADISRSYSSNDSKVPPVVQLPVETLTDLLKDDDESVRVTTAFLMAMEGGDQGIEILARHWKSKEKSYERRKAGEMLVRAIVLAWDDSMTRYLEEAYELAAKENGGYEVRELYNLVKGLKGEEIKKLRARMKREFPNQTSGW